MAREYDKLVRDGIPAVIEADGEEPIVHVADEEEYERRLREKLLEEAEEFAESGEIEELADVLAVVDAYREQTGISAEQLDRQRAEKAADRGGFGERIVLERVEEQAIRPAANGVCAPPGGTFFTSSGVAKRVR